MFLTSADGKKSSDSRRTLNVTDARVPRESAGNPISDFL